MGQMGGFEFVSLQFDRILGILFQCTDVLSILCL